MKIVALSGSLRQHSINTGLLRALQNLASDEVVFEILDYQQVPFYNQDDEDIAMPEAVTDLAQKIQQADAVIIACPEYNYSIPGALKNILDWLSRVDSQPMTRKTVAILGASPGMTGTVRAQVHLRQVLQYFDAEVLNKPEMYVNQSNQKFDEQGNLTDPTTRKYLQRLLDSLIDKVAK